MLKQLFKSKYTIGRAILHRRLLRPINGVGAELGEVQLENVCKCVGKTLNSMQIPHWLSNWVPSRQGKPSGRTTPADWVWGDVRCGAWSCCEVHHQEHRGHALGAALVEPTLAHASASGSSAASWSCPQGCWWGSPPSLPASRRQSRRCFRHQRIRPSCRRSRCRRAWTKRIARSWLQSQCNFIYFVFKNSLHALKSRPKKSWSFWCGPVPVLSPKSDRKLYGGADLGCAFSEAWRLESE